MWTLQKKLLLKWREKIGYLDVTIVYQQVGSHLPSKANWSERYLLQTSFPKWLVTSKKKQCTNLTEWLLITSRPLQKALFPQTSGQRGQIAVYSDPLPASLASALDFSEVQYALAKSRYCTSHRQYYPPNPTPCKIWNWDAGIDNSVSCIDSLHWKLLLIPWTFVLYVFQSIPLI